MFFRNRPESKYKNWLRRHGTPDTVGYSYEGFMTPEMRFERRLMFKEYELKDHLGNVRLVFGDATVADAAGETRLDVRALSNYYPFGMLQPTGTIRMLATPTAARDLTGLLSEAKSRLHFHSINLSGRRTTT